MKISLFKKISLAAFALASFGFTVSASANDANNFENDKDSARYCRDERVSLLCRVDGRNRQLRATTDCGPSREGSYCDAVYTPGYRQIHMELEWRCRRGRWVWVLGDRGWCEVRSGW